MRARTLTGAVAALLVLAIAVGGGAALAGRSKASTPAASSDVLRIGTVNYIDSLNPYNYIEAQATNAMIMIYPQLVQYGPGLKFQGDCSSCGRTASGRTGSR